MLHVPVGSNSFGVKQSSVGSTRPAATYGTALTPGLNTDGSWTSVITAADHDSFGILININSNRISNGSRGTKIDIGIDDAGGTSYISRIPDLLCGGASAFNIGGSGVWYYFPIFIPAGARIAVRGNSTVATAFRVNLLLMQQPSNPAMIRKGSFVESIGMSGNVGTVVVPGTTSEGAWTLIGTTVSRLWWWEVGFQVSVADTGWAAALINVDLAAGDATNKKIIIQDHPIATSTAENFTKIQITAGVEWDVPAGTNIYIRAQSSTTLDAYTCAAYGLGG
jgi:hypothetical protein